jgi:IS30 family transposase
VAVDAQRRRDALRKERGVHEQPHHRQLREVLASNHGDGCEPTQVARWRRVRVCVCVCAMVRVLGG